MQALLLATWLCGLGRCFAANSVGVPSAVAAMSRAAITAAAGLSLHIVLMWAHICCCGSYLQKELERQDKYPNLVEPHRLKGLTVGVAGLGGWGGGEHKYTRGTARCAVLMTVCGVPKKPHRLKGLRRRVLRTFCMGSGIGHI